MSTNREDGNPNVSPIFIDLRYLSFIQALQTLAENDFTIDGSLFNSWRSYPDSRLQPGEKDPPVYIIWINDGEAEKLTITDSNGDVRTLRPGQDLHYFIQPESIGGEPDWFVYRTKHVMA